MAARVHIVKHSPSEVALLIETSTEFGRNVLQGVSQYLPENRAWSVRFE